MDPVNPDSSPPPPQFPEHPYTDIPGLTANPNLKPVRRLKLYLPLLLLLVLLPIATGAVLLRQSLSGEAAFSFLGCRIKPASVKIHPGKIQTTVGSPPIGLSALAYDKENRPIWKGVTYEWGMSSTQSIGNLIPNGNLATFIAQNPGRGDIFAVAKYCNNKATGSSLVIVSSAPSPTPTPCIPRPPCLDLGIRACKMPQPANGWCPKTTSTPVPVLRR
jgi:hypothetical protein